MDEKIHYRRKIFRIQHSDLLGILNWQVQDVIKLPIIEQFPKGYIIGGVFYDFAGDCFLIRVHHESYPEINPSLIPEVEDYVKMYKIVIIPEDKKC